MDFNKIINAVCNYLGREAEDAKNRKNKIIENKQIELRGFSDQKIKNLFKNRDKLKDIPRDLVEQEARRRGIR